MINFISNGTFDLAGSTAWSLSERATIISNGSCRFENLGRGGMLYAKQNAPLTAGRSYELSWNALAYGRYDIWCGYGYYDANSNYQMVHSPSMESQVEAHYNRLSYVINIPASCSNINVDVYIFAGADAVDGWSHAYIDDVTLYDRGVIDNNVAVTWDRYSAPAGSTITATTTVSGIVPSTYKYFFFTNDHLTGLTPLPTTTNTRTLSGVIAGKYAIGVFVQATNGQTYSGMSDWCVVSGSSGSLNVNVWADKTTANVNERVTWQASATGNIGPIDWSLSLFAPSNSPSNPPIPAYSNYIQTPVNEPGTWYAQFTATDLSTGQSVTKAGGYVTVSGSVDPDYIGDYYQTNARDLTPAESEVNARVIFAYMRSKGWTKNAICGMLGNMEYESKINPGRYGNGGTDSTVFGLVQWSHASKYLDWATQNGYSSTSMKGQLERILFEVTLTGSQAQWIARYPYASWTFPAYTQSTDTASNLAHVFQVNYERGGNESERRRLATNWFNLLA